MANQLFNSNLKIVDKDGLLTREGLQLFQDNTIDPKKQEAIQQRSNQNALEIAKFAAELVELKARLDSHESRISEQKTRIDNHETRISEQKTRIDNHETRLRKLEKNK